MNSDLWIVEVIEGIHIDSIARIPGHDVLSPWSTLSSNGLLFSVTQFSSGQLCDWITKSKWFTFYSKENDIKYGFSLQHKLLMYYVILSRGLHTIYTNKKIEHLFVLSSVWEDPLITQRTHLKLSMLTNIHSSKIAQIL